MEADANVCEPAKKNRRATPCALYVQRLKSLLSVRRKADVSMVKKVENITVEGGALAHVVLSVDGVPCEVVERDGPNGSDSELVVRTVQGRWETEAGIVWEHKIVLRGDEIPQEVREAMVARRRAVEEEAAKAVGESCLSRGVLPGPHFLGHD